MTIVRWENKIEQPEPGSKDGVITLAEFRIRTEVQKTVDKNWKDRMENEDKITNGKIESLHSVVNRLEHEVTALKDKHSISAASTVATSSGCGGSHVGAGIPGGPSVWLPSRIEPKGWGVWSRIRETGLTDEKAKEQVGQVKSLTPAAHHDKFDWELTDKDQGNFDLKMMVFPWFKNEVTPKDRKMAQLDVSHSLQRTPIVIGGEKIRATLEIDPAKRPWNKDSAIFFTIMKEHAKLDRDMFAVRWVTLRPSCRCQLRSKGVDVVDGSVSIFHHRRQLGDQCGYFENDRALC